MPSRLRYSDAVKLLGGSSPAVEAIDNLLGTALSVATLGGSEVALGFFDAKAEMVRLGRSAFGKLQDGVRGTGRYDRNLRLQAAHGILVVTAFFEALDEIVVAAEFPPPELTRGDQLVLAARGPIDDADWRRVLLTDSLPVPSPETTYDALLQQLAEWYSTSGEWFGTHLIGLAEWDRADERSRRAVTLLLAERLPERALGHYEQMHRKLAVDVPEFAVWVDRAESRALGRGLLGLEAALRRVASGNEPSLHRAALAAAYRAELDRPILGGGVGGGLTIPQLGEAYVDARFQAKECGPAARPADDHWWDTAERGDLSAFLARYLLTPSATIAPMLLLGQPGAGKSALTRILAARLPAADFLAVRVVLREVPAEAEIQDQVEYALRHAIGETVSWADLARSADGALPVVMLDGFDELLQATGVHQSDYLQRVAKFQLREAVQGRPVAVIVTSRVAVADRARMPEGGLAVRLEPFDDAQVRQWLATWNTANVSALTARGLQPLPAEVAHHFPDLVRQPLLLLMLALYDAAENALQSADASFGTVQLYERLLGDFALREVRRWNEGRPDDELIELVADELMRLSIVAFAMFNRSRQWVTEDELNKDLADLRIEPARETRSTGFRSPVTAGQEVVGRFFFIQRAQASQDGRARQTFEFLHATFGEYLVARLVVNIVRENAAIEAARTMRLRGTTADDELLQSLIGCVPLASRNTVMLYLAELMPIDVRGWLIGRLRMAVTEPEYTPRAYRPGFIRPDHWMATYSLNLTLLVLACGPPLRAGELWTETNDPAYWMRSTAQIWKGAVPTGMFMDVMAVIDVERVWSEGRRDVVISLLQLLPHEDPGPMWTLSLQPGSLTGKAGTFLSPSPDLDDAERSMALTNNVSDDLLLHALEPFYRYGSESLGLVFVHGPDDLESLANSVLSLWIASLTGRGKNLTEAYQRAMDAMIGSVYFHGWMIETEFCAVLILRSAVRDVGLVPPEIVVDFLARLAGAELPGDAADAFEQCAATLPEPLRQSLSEPR